MNWLEVSRVGIFGRGREGLKGGWGGRGWRSDRSFRGGFDGRYLTRWAAEHGEVLLGFVGDGFMVFGRVGELCCRNPGVKARML